MPQQQTQMRSGETGSPVDIPARSRTIKLSLVAISGSAGKTSTGWMLVNMLELAGLEVAAWLSNGVYVDRKIRHDELHAWELATFAARAREINTLIQEIPTVLAGGLPAGSIECAVFTSICGSDGQCQRGSTAQRDQEAARAVAAAVSVGGRIVANADDLMIVDAIADSNCSVTYYALSGANPVLRKHVGQGGDACWAQNGWIKIQTDGGTRNIVRTSLLPNTLGGHLLFQVQNALAAIAAALPMLGGDSVLVNAVVATGQSEPDFEAGVRILSEDGKTVLVDEPRSILSIRQLARAVRSFAPKRVIVCIDDLSLLSDDEGLEAARILGSLAGKAVVFENGTGARKYEHLKRAMMSSHDPPAIVVRDVGQATLEHVFSLLDTGDIALILTGDMNNG
ncbi:hypothetical protein BH23CHL2_BH23CHL2_19350 [soil metagenome]